MAATVMELYGSKVFNEHEMRERLPSSTYKSLKATIEKGQPLDLEVANVVASVMKRWAIEQGATHYTHWFQPLTGITSEKHDGFVSPQPDGTAIMEFSGKELIKGEPDASSFPSGGLRATAEARGYTAWDPTSYAFVKDDVLCIPTAFCSYTGEALDKKTPLLRSMQAISDQACKVLHLFGKDVPRVATTVGPEQEYFLIRKEDYEKRLDLVLTGRTLFGSAPSKGQELEEHYFGTLRPVVSEFMKELDEELWKLGIPAKTKHNEVAPAQHELAPIYDTTNVAIDHNLLTMEMMKKIASKHGLVCLQHEKPFEGVNGSGKHNNWSLSTDGGENLLDPGTTPAENTQFLLFLTAVIKAVDDYQDLLRISVASAGNDHRLGANEAPPAIVSMYVGDELQAVIDCLVAGKPCQPNAPTVLDTGAVVLPNLPKDTSDRNRTSPFAFTGNKFEFRMPGSSFNIACTNVMLNTAVAESLRQFADVLEQTNDLPRALLELIRGELTAHQRILFNGNGYSHEWEVEAARRGLSNFRTTPEALVHYTDQKNVELFTRHGVYTRDEIQSRQDILRDEYAKAIRIEALTLLDLVRCRISPACVHYATELTQGVNAKKQLGIEVPQEETLTRHISALTGQLMQAADQLEGRLADPMAENAAEAASWCAHTLIPAMDAVRTPADRLEQLVDRSVWPLPTYSDMLFYV